MDSKSVTSSDKDIGLEIRKHLTKLQFKSKQNDQNTSSKQIPSTSEPKQRVIKQIVSLDSKKLKALGIESNILSALTKFNGKEKPTIKTESVTSVNDTETSTSILPSEIVEIDSSLPIPSTSTAISSATPTIASHRNLAKKQVSTKNSPKKIQVLSDVLLSDNKLDLKIFPAITSPVRSKHLAYVSPVTRPSQIKRCDVSASSTSVIIQPEKEITSIINEKIISKPIASPEKPPNKLEKLRLNSLDEIIEKNTAKSPIKDKSIAKSPIKLPTTSPIKQKPETSVVSSPKSEPSTSGMTAVKEFSTPELTCSRTEFEHVQSEVRTNPTNDIDAVDVCNDDGETKNDSESLNGSLHYTDLSNSFSASDSSDSDSESDLDELIKEAQLTIENEQNVKLFSHLSEEPPPASNLTKKIRFVEKKIMDMLTEHVDRDRIIDDFLASTMTSFRTECTTPSDSESESDSNEVGLQNEQIEFMMEDSMDIKDEPNVEDNSELVQHEPINEEEKISIKSRKRKYGVVPETSPKRKKIQVIDHENVPVQISEAKAIVENSPDVPKSALESLDETNEGMDCLIQFLNKFFQMEILYVYIFLESPNVTEYITPDNAYEQSPSLEAISQPVYSKRGRKPKQTILNDYFAVQNSILNATKESLDEVLTRVNSTVEPAKRSSSFGRIIKPKSYDIETTTRVKKDRKIRKEIIVEATFEPQQQQQHINHEIKTESVAPKPLKKRGRERNIAIPNESANVSEFSAEDSFVSSTPIVEQTRGRKKAIKPVQSQPIPENENISTDFTEERNNTPVVEAPTAVPKRGRGRPPKKSLVHLEPLRSVEILRAVDTLPSVETSSANNDVNVSMEMESAVNDLAATPTATVPKRRGRKPKNFVLENSSEISSTTLNTTDSIISQEDSFKSPQEVIPKRRGRKSKNATNIESSNESQIEMETESSVDTTRLNYPSTSQVIVAPPRKRGRQKQCLDGIKYMCGNCETEIAASKWKAHMAVHLGVTFRRGIDEEIDVHDSNTMARLITRYMKLNRVPYLKCPKCDDRKRSALGYISHVEICGLTDEEAKQLKAICEFCNKLYRKVSLASHQQSFCPVRRLEIAQQQAAQLVKSAEQNDQIVEVVYSESGRPKRMIKKSQPIPKNVDEFIKVGFKITGGTFKNWSNQLREENFIKCTNDGCEFIAPDLVEIRKHFLQCRESILQCRICAKTERTRDAIVQHIETSHPEELKAQESDENDKDDDFSGQSSDSSNSSDGEFLEEFNTQSDRKRKNKPLKRKHVIPLKRIMEEDCPVYWEMLSSFYTRLLNSRPGFHGKSYEWTKEFVEENYDLGALTLNSHLRNTFEIVRLPQREVNKFLNLLHAKSARFLCQTQKEYQREKSVVNDDETWSNLNLFESFQTTHTKNRTSIIFCGGKIITSDWIPFPNDYKGDQILAIVSQNSNAQPLNQSKCQPMEKCKNLIQLWSITTDSTGQEVEKTSFMYGILYEDGPICTIAFCPSDAYVASKRLAIVAVPDTNGSVNIISIPDNVSKAKTNMSTIIKLKADIRLQTGLSIEENSSKIVTQMSWSRTKGHKILCAAYNTGLIAVWNFDHLNSTYMTHRAASNDIPILLPQYTFMGALSFVTQLDMKSDNDGNVRWILVGSLDRRVRLYDLQDPQLTPFTSPIFKSRIISGTWPLHWPIYLTIIDAALTQQSGGLYIKPVLYTNNQPTSTNLLNECEPSNLTFSDWLNTGIYGNEVGDLFMINFQQLLLHDRFDESSQQKVLSCTDFFVDEEATSDVEQANIKDHVSILFKDFEDVVYSPKMQTRIPTLQTHPFARITRVAINPNESHQKLYATGYELGFCRIQFIPG